MANRSYIYLKNGDEARVLAEGIYMIPYFWQLCFGVKKSCKQPLLYGKKQKSLKKKIKEKQKNFSPEK